MAGVKRLDLGGDILLSGDTREEVDAAFQDIVRRGGGVISPLSQVGHKWVAACTQPRKIDDVDTTSTLSLHEIEAAMRRRAEAALCTVEEFGFKVIVSGPTHDAVYARVMELIRDGAMLVTDAEESFGTWVAVCDTAASPKR